MNYFTVKNGAVVVLALVCLASWYFSWTTFRNHKEDIYIQLAEIAEEFALPYRIARLSAQPRDEALPVPVYGIELSQIDDTWGAAREEGRAHEGTDIFAPLGTPVFASVPGYVMRTGFGERGGNFVFIIGAGGVRYYYAHLDAIAVGIERGEEVGSDAVLGFVGSTGNATGTPPHLHFGLYEERRAQNPFPLLVDRAMTDNQQ